MVLHSGERAVSLLRVLVRVLCLSCVSLPSGTPGSLHQCRTSWLPEHLNNTDEIQREKCFKTLCGEIPMCLVLYVQIAIPDLGCNTVSGQRVALGWSVRFLSSRSESNDLMGGSDVVAETGGGLNSPLFLFLHYETSETVYSLTSFLYHHTLIIRTGSQIPQNMRVFLLSNSWKRKRLCHTHVQIIFLQVSLKLCIKTGTNSL